MIKTDTYKTKPIVYYDGQCGFCAGFVRVLINTSNIDKRLCFMPYQAVSKEIPDELLMVFPLKYYEAGGAAIKVLIYSGGIYKIIALALKLLPPKTLDKLYYIFARNRHFWFNQTTCVIN